MRSDQLPPTIDTAAFTTCSAAHISGTNATLPATSVSFSSRNASVELPSVNSASTSMNGVELRAAAASARAGIRHGPAAAGRCGRRRRSVRLQPDVVDAPLGTKKISATAIAPGMIVSANSVR